MFFINKILTRYHKKDEFNNIKELLNFKFQELKFYPINCFHSNNLDIFTFANWKASHYPNKKDLKDLIINKSEDKQIQLDLIKIDSISASKSKSAGYKFDSIYDFGKYLILERGHNWTLHECEKHIKEKLNDNIYKINYYEWNNRYEWNNIDGSHHFAVANFIITNQRLNYKINCQVETYGLNKNKIKNLLDSFHIFIISTNLQNFIFNIFNFGEIKFYGVNEDMCIVLIKKSEDVNILIKLFRNIDNKYIFNLDEYLSSLIKY
jgi:hypothetical protein